MSVPQKQPTHTASFEQMSVRAFEQLTALPPQRLPSVAANASARLSRTPVRSQQTQRLGRPFATHESPSLLTSTTTARFSSACGSLSNSAMSILFHSTAIRWGVQPNVRIGGKSPGRPGGPGWTAGSPAISGTRQTSCRAPGSSGSGRTAAMRSSPTRTASSTTAGSSGP